MPWSKDVQFLYQEQECSAMHNNLEVELAIPVAAMLLRGVLSLAESH